MIKINTAESHFLFYTVFFLLESQHLHYPQCNSWNMLNDRLPAVSAAFHVLYLFPVNSSLQNMQTWWKLLSSLSACCCSNTSSCGGPRPSDKHHRGRETLSDKHHRGRRTTHCGWDIVSVKKRADRQSLIWLESSIIKRNLVNFGLDCVVLQDVF